MQEYNLSAGVVGSQIVAHFAKEGKVAVKAASLGVPGPGQHDYAVTFAHGITQSYRATFADMFGSKILDLAPMN